MAAKENIFRLNTYQKMCLPLKFIFVFKKYKGFFFKAQVFDIHSLSFILLKVFIDT